MQKVLKVSATIQRSSRLPCRTHCFRPQVRSGRSTDEVAHVALTIIDDSFRMGSRTTGLSIGIDLPSIHPDERVPVSVFIVVPFVVPISFELSPRFRTNAYNNVTKSIKDISRCSECGAYLNPHCEFNSTRWFCSLCGRRNGHHRPSVRSSTSPCNLISSFVPPFTMAFSCSDTSTSIRSFFRNSTNP